MYSNVVWLLVEEWPFFVGTVLAKKSKTVPTNNTTGMRIYYMSIQRKSRSGVCAQKKVGTVL